MGRFKDKVVLITGALGGIGSATVRRFAADDASFIRGQILEVSGGARL